MTPGEENFPLIRPPGVRKLREQVSEQELTSELLTSNYWMMMYRRWHECILNEEMSWCEGDMRYNRYILLLLILIIFFDRE